MQLEEVDWVVLTPRNLPEGDDWVIIGLDPDNHETLSRNQIELLRWITEARRRYELARQGDAAE